MLGYDNKVIAFGILYLLFIFLPNKYIRNITGNNKEVKDIRKHTQFLTIVSIGFYILIYVLKFSIDMEVQKGSHIINNTYVINIILYLLYSIAKKNFMNKDEGILTIPIMNLLVLTGYYINQNTVILEKLKYVGKYIKQLKIDDEDLSNKIISFLIVEIILVSLFLIIVIGNKKNQDFLKILCSGYDNKLDKKSCGNDDDTDKKDKKDKSMTKKCRFEIVDNIIEYTLFIKFIMLILSIFIILYMEKFYKIGNLLNG